MEEESRAVKLALESHNLFIVGLCCFGTIVTLFTLDSVVSWSLMML